VEGANPSGNHPRRNLPDDALVVRGGESKSVDLRISVERHHARSEYREWGLSGCASPGKSAEDIAREAAELGRDTGRWYLPHPTMRTAPAKALRELSCVESVEIDRDDMHVKIQLTGEPSDDELASIRGAFGPILENPRPKPKL
jgi:hypothetical protein